MGRWYQFTKWTFVRHKIQHDLKFVDLTYSEFHWLILFYNLFYDNPNLQKNKKQKTNVVTQAIIDQVLEDLVPEELESSTEAPESPE